MRVPLIATLDASSKETRPFPALDGVGRILFSNGDGDSIPCKADSVECRDVLQNGKNEINFWLKEAPPES